MGAMLCVRTSTSRLPARGARVTHTDASQRCDGTVLLTDRVKVNHETLRKDRESAAVERRIRSSGTETGAH
jgi:hypothetical protein